MKTLFDVYLKENYCKKFYLTIHRLDGQIESKTYKSFKSVYAEILYDFPTDKMMTLEVVNEKTEGSNIFLELIEHSSNLKVHN